VSGENYESKKNDVLSEKKIMQITIHLKDLSIEGTERVLLKERPINFTKYAFRKLAIIMGLNKTLVESFSKNAEFLDAILSLLKKRTNKNKKVILYYNKTLKEITNVFD